MIQPSHFATIHRPPQIWLVGLSLCLVALCISAQITADNNCLMLIGLGASPKPRRQCVILVARWRLVILTATALTM